MCLICFSKHLLTKWWSFLGVAWDLHIRTVLSDHVCAYFTPVTMGLGDCDAFVTKVCSWSFCWLKSEHSRAAELRSISFQFFRKWRYWCGTRLFFSLELWYWSLWLKWALCIQFSPVLTIRRWVFVKYWRWLLSRSSKTSLLWALLELCAPILFSYVSSRAYTFVGRIPLFDNSPLCFLRWSKELIISIGLLVISMSSLLLVRWSWQQRCCLGCGYHSFVLISCIVF